MAFSPNGVCMPNSEPEPDVSNEPALIGHDTSWGPHEEVQSDGGLLKFFRGGDPVERCLQDPNLRQHVTDADFCKRLRKLRTQAEAAKTPEEISAVTRQMLNDPRLTQCSMAGAGMTLTVEESDLQRAERLGDIAKRSPLRIEDLVKAQQIGDKETAKKMGNDAFAAKEYATALAYWTRALRFDREEGRVDDVDVAGNVYCNMSLALLKLGFNTRAEQAATRAIKYCDFAMGAALDRRRELEKAVECGYAERVDEADPGLKLRLLDGTARRKALYRRSLAREKLHRYTLAHADAADAERRASRDGNADDAEKKTLRREVARFVRLKKHEEQELRNRATRKAEEAAIEHQRAHGVALDADRKKQSAVATPGASVGYLEEKDHSRWALIRLAALLEDVDVDLGRGASVCIADTDKNRSSVSASVTRKRGKRALYYDIDVHASWVASPPQDFDLSPPEGEARPRDLEGTVRLYNVSHETKYEPGADTNVAYMYQLGYKGIDPKWFDGAQATPDCPPWAAILINGAHELYEAAAKVADALIAELKVK